MTVKIDPLETLAQVAASEVKKRGWRGVMKALKAEGSLVVTNHDEPEAVIIRADDYSRLVDVVKQAASRTESELEALRRRFDERLAVLEAPGAGDRLRAVMRAPARLRGRVKAGTGY